MMDNTQHFIIAPRQECLSALPADWQTQIGDIDGIDVTGATPSRMQIAAGAAALDKAKEKLGHLLHFEENLPRTL